MNTSFRASHGGAAGAASAPTSQRGVVTANGPRKLVRSSCERGSTVSRSSSAFGGTAAACHGGRQPPYWKAMKTGRARASKQPRAGLAPRHTALRLARGKSAASSSISCHCRRDASCIFATHMSDQLAAPKTSSASVILGTRHACERTARARCHSNAYWFDAQSAGVHCARPGRTRSIDEGVESATSCA